jgi:lipoprotein-anchoring transpeptidase ErfK/SrfK
VSLRKLRFATLVFVAAAALAPAAAWAAAPQLEVPLDGIDWSAGTVTVAAAYPVGTKTVFFSVDAQPLATVAIADPTVAGTVSSGVPYRLAAPIGFGVDALDAQGASLGTATLSLSAKMYVPSTPRLGVANGALVEPSSTFGATSNRTVTGVAVTAGPEPLTRHVKLVTGANGRIELGGVRVPYGIERLKLSASNGFGSSAPSKARTVYNLGSLSRLPRRSRFVLVDKRSMTLYDVRDRHVVSHYEIAIGTPSTPTPNGYFKIGAALPASGPWGVLRRPLYRFSSSKSWPSGFYIHGTNAPWDIGTWASHGCVRLYNWAIRRFAKTVPNGTMVLIRR